MPHILDTNRDTRGHYDRLKAAGYDTYIRYIAAPPARQDKCVSDAEARAIAAVGLQLALVYEVNGRPRGADVGHRDGVYAKKRAQQLGAPAGTIIWYTADEDTTDAIFGPTRDAFVAFRDAIAPYRCGGYASGWMLDKLFSAGVIVARWLTDSTGFRGSKASAAAGRYELKQALPTPVAGLDTDPDAEHLDVTGKGPDIGAFVPFGAAAGAAAMPPAPPDHPAPPAPKPAVSVATAPIVPPPDRQAGGGS
jgi:hypothetical protein